MMSSFVKDYVNEGGIETPSPVHSGSNEDAVRSIDITSEPIDFSVAGWVIVNCTPTALSGSDQFVIDINGGSSTNACGIRMTATDDLVNSRFRGAAGGSPNSLKLDGAKAYDNQPIKVGLMWDSQKNLTIISQGYQEVSTMNDAPAAVDTIDLLSRNGGSQAFTGILHYWEVGNEAISIAQLQERMAKASCDIPVGSGGQSLMENHFTSADTGSRVGRLKFTEQLGSDLIIDGQWVSGAVGGAALSIRTDGTNYYLDDTNNNVLGPAFVTFFDNMRAAGIITRYITWAQGEAESHKIDTVDEITEAEYKQLLIDTFNIMRREYPDVIIIIQKIGRRSDTFSNTGGIQTVARVQQQLIDDDAQPWIKGGIETFDLGLVDETGATDGVHLSDVAEPIACERLARYTAICEGANLVGVNGMEMTAAVRASLAVTVTVAHDAGTDFTPTTAIEGFVFFDDGVEIAITAAVRTNATTITLTLNSTPTGVEELFYAYDEMAGITPANLVKDNATVSMPLRRGKITL